VSNSTLTLNEMLWLAHKIIFHDVTKNVVLKNSLQRYALLPEHKTLFKISKEKGLPIGNLTSQFFANVYLNGFDNFCKRELKCKKYIRYVDDFVIFSDTKAELLQIKDKIQKYLFEKLKLSLREHSILKEVKDGIDFLGYIVRPNYILVRKRVVQNYKRKKAIYLDAYEQENGKMNLSEIKQFLSIQASFFGHIKHANSYNLRKKVGNLNENNPFSSSALNLDSCSSRSR
jgi:hypothetical protein